MTGRDEGVGSFVSLSGARNSPPREIGDIATRQHGRITRAQLSALGLSRKQIDTRRGAGLLLDEYRNVFVVGHRTRTPEGRWMGAVLACGIGAAMSIRASGAVWAIRPSRILEVTVPWHRRITVPGIVIHRSRRLGPEDVTVKNGIPVTTPARTILDLAEILDTRDLEQALAEARYLRLLGDAVPSLPGRKHPHRLQDLTRTADTSRTATAGEEALLMALRAAGAPEPLCNHPIRGASGATYRADLLFPEAGLIVEVDGGSHTLPGRKQHDRARDMDLRLLGLTTHRLPDETVRADPAAAARVVLHLLHHDERRLAPAFG